MLATCAEYRSGLRVLLLAGVAALLVGCAAGPGPRSSNTQAEPQPRAAVNGARVEVDGELGFTVTEVVRIGSDVRADYRDALALLRRDELTEGIRLLESVVERAPELTAPLIDLGIAYRRTGAYEQARESLEAALALTPDHPVALNELGIVQRATGSFAEARESYERALAVHSGYHLALRNLGVLCDLYLEDLSCALASYERYAEIVPDDADVSIWIADIRNRLGTSP